MEDGGDEAAEETNTPIQINHHHHHLLSTGHTFLPHPKHQSLLISHTLCPRHHYGREFPTPSIRSRTKQSYMMRVVTRAQAGTPDRKEEIIRHLMGVFNVIGYRHGHSFSLSPYRVGSEKNPIGVYDVIPECDVLEEYYLGGIGQLTQCRDSTEWKVFRFRCTSSIGLE